MDTLAIQKQFITFIKVMFISNHCIVNASDNHVNGHYCTQRREKKMKRKQKILKKKKANTK